MSNERAIFLDFSNTITTVESENMSMKKWLDLIKQKYDLEGDVFRRFADARMNKLIDREKNFRTFMDINKEALLELYGISEIYEEDYYRSHEANLRLRPSFINFITSVRGEFQTVVVTDADNIYTKRTLAALGIDGYFDLIITAEQVKAPKPDPRIFNAALKEANFPARVIFIGDSERRDVEGAKRMNFLVLKMDNDSGPTIADEKVHNFDEALEVMRKRKFV